jgi:valyl-tRNA synthetase
VKIIPEMWEKVYFEWMENIRDWCISRQIWWGHRIPVWFCDACNKMYVSVEDIAECKECGGKLRQESDVLDTWFSSGLWPFTTLGWPEKTEELKTFYPTALLITGFDILFFWVARMIMMGIRFMGDVPFKEVYIHALVRDAEGKKMSKSKGNVIDPLVMIDEYGTDAFRFSLTMLAAQGRDILLSEERVEGARNFVNKIWNASKLAFTFIEGLEQSVGGEKSRYLPDRWIRSRAAKVAREVRESIETYRFNDSATTLYTFVWHEFCDWYLELIKPNLYGKATGFDDVKTRETLYRTLSDILKLLHPIMPFVTEELYMRLPARDADSIMIAPFPAGDGVEIDEESEEGMDMIMGVIDSVRNIRGETGIAPNVKVSAVIKAGAMRPLLEEYGYYIRELAKIEDLSFTDGDAPGQAAIGLYKGVEVFVPLKGVIDVSRELGRIGKELMKAEGEMEKLFNKLNNQSFRQKAPEEVIAKNETQYRDFQEKREKLLVSKKILEELSGN